MNNKQTEKIKTRCPICSNYIYGRLKDDGVLACSCKYCKSIVYSQEKYNGREKVIRVKFIEVT